MSKITLNNCPTMPLFEFKYNGNILELQYMNPDDESQLFCIDEMSVDITTELDPVTGFPLPGARIEIFQHVEKIFQEGIESNKKKCGERKNEVRHLFAGHQHKGIRGSVSIPPLLFDTIDREHSDVERCLKETLEKMQKQLPQIQVQKYFTDYVKDDALTIRKWRYLLLMQFNNSELENDFDLNKDVIEMIFNNKKFFIELLEPNPFTIQKNIQKRGPKKGRNPRC